MEINADRGAPESRWKDLQEDLHAGGLLFQSVFEGTPVGINLTDLEGRVLLTNPAFARMLGCDVSELQAKTFEAITHPDDRETDRRLFDELLSGTRDHYRIEKRYVRLDGRVVWVRLSVSLIHDATGAPRFTIGVAEDITERKEMEEALRTSETRFRQLFENSNDIVYTHDLSGRFTSINRAAERVSGYSRDEVLAMTVAQVIAPEDFPLAQRMIAEKLNGRESTRYEIALITKDGRRVILEVSTQLIVEDDQVVGIQGVGRDITARRQAETLLRESERRFASAFEHSPIGMSLVGLDGRWLQVNRALCDLLGYGEDDLKALRFQDLTHPDDLEADLALLQRFLDGELSAHTAEKRYFHRSGNTVWVRRSVSLVTHTDGTPWYFVVQVEDVSDQKRAREALEALLDQQAATLEAIEHRAVHDALTGLPNRTLGMDRLHHAVLSARRRSSTCAVLLLDLDGFKAVNDAHGHAAGDACLVEVARRLERAVRRADTVARLGGDEFVIVLPDANDLGAKQVESKLDLVLAPPIDLPSGPVTVGASVGLALYPAHGEDAQALLHHADMSMYSGKRKGKGGAVKAAG